MSKLLCALGAIGFLLVLGAAGASDCGEMPMRQALVHVGVGVAMIAIAITVYLHKEKRRLYGNTGDASAEEISTSSV